MIVFLTLAYVGVLLLMYTIGLIRLTLFWKLSPVLWFLLLNLVLFIPMQWGAPAGPVGVARYAIEIVPAVTGQVTEVPVKPLSEVKEGDVLFQIDREPFAAEVERLKAALVDAEQQPAVLQSNVKIAEAQLAQATAEQSRASRELKRIGDLLQQSAASQDQFDSAQQEATVADRSVDSAQAQLDQAKLLLAAETSAGENTAVAQARQALVKAQYDLDHTTVKAPTDGVVQQLALRPGARVASLPLRGSMVFVDTSRSLVSVAIAQNQLRYVEAGQEAEVVLKYRPGMTLKAKVIGITATTSVGQIQVSGVVEDFSSRQKTNEPYQVVLEIVDDRIDVQDIPGGAIGTAAIFTEKVGFTHVIRKVMLRMQAWTNYVF